MKLKTILAIGVICYTAAGCKSKLAMDYNNMIAKDQKSLNQSIDQAEPDLKNYFASFQYDSIVNISAKMESKIDSIMNDIRKRPVPKVKQGDNFKKAALAYFGYMKSIYTSYKAYGSQSTPEGRQFQLQVMTTVTSQEDKAIADMRQAQKIFAKDNNFKIQSEKKSQNNSLTASPPNQ